MDGQDFAFILSILSIHACIVFIYYSCEFTMLIKKGRRSLETSGLPRFARNDGVGADGSLWQYLLLIASGPLEIIGRIGYSA